MFPAPGRRNPQRPRHDRRERPDRQISTAMADTSPRRRWPRPSTSPWRASSTSPCRSPTGRSPTRAAWAGNMPSTQLRVHLARAWARILAGDILDVEAEAERRRAAAVRDGADMPRVGWSVVLGLAAVLRGHPRSAATVLREAVAVMGDDDRGWGRPSLRLPHHGGGDDGRQRRRRRNLRSTRRGGEPEHRRVRGGSGEEHACAAAARAASSAPPCATAISAADLARRRGQHALEALALHEVVRLGRPGDVVDRLTELASVVDGALVDAAARRTPRRRPTTTVSVARRGGRRLRLPWARPHRRGGVHAPPLARTAAAGAPPGRRRHGSAPHCARRALRGGMVLGAERSTTPLTSPAASARWPTSPRQGCRAGSSASAWASPPARSTTCSAACT